MTPSRSIHALSVLAAAFFIAGAHPAGKIPVTTDSKEALSRFIQGQRLVDNLRLADAIPYFQKAIEKDAGFALAHLYLAQTAPTAKSFFAELSKADETSAHASKGEQLWIKAFKAGAYADPSTALRLYQELAEAFPDDERAQTLLGTSYLAQQDYVQAAENLKRATEIAPHFAPAYNQLGYVYRFLKRYEDAERTFKKYTELLPHDPNPFDSYAELLLKMGRFDESIAQYRKALAVDPKFANSFAGIAACLMYQDRPEEALAELQKAYDNARNDGERRAALFSRGVVYQDEGKTDMALQEIEKQHTVAEKAHDPAAMAGDLALMGNMLLHDGKADEALAKFDASLSLIEGSPLAKEVKENAALIHHYNVAKVRLLKEDIASATEEAEKFKDGAERGKNRNQIRLAFELSGMIAMHQNDHAQAVDQLMKANQQDPNVLYNLALALKASSRTDEAREYATRAARFYALPQMNYAYVRRLAEKLIAAL
jgi:tetratricopeptide (TPR) repeat protein